MRRFMNKAFAIIVSVVLVCALALQGCTTSSDNEEKKTVRGTHQREIVKTDDKIISDGRTEYKVLIPENASEKILVAKQEFLMFFQEASGIRIEAISDENYDADGKYVSIGHTALLDAENIVPADNLGDEGFEIKTQNKSIFLYGHKDAGALNATYELLNLLFGFETYYYDTYYIDTQVNELALYQYNIKEIPDFKTRATGYDVLTENPTLIRRWRQVEMWELFEQVGEKVHNGVKLLYNTKKVNIFEHSGWFYNNNIDLEPSRWKVNQICYSAHGDVEEQKLMWQVVAEEMIDVIKASNKPKEETLRMHFDLSDNALACSCDACKRAVEEYGSLAGLSVLACNKISDIIEQWMDSEEGKEYKRDFEVYFLAYYGLAAAPVKYDESKKDYIATIVCKENVIPMYAPARMDFMQSVYADVNKEYKEEMERWQKVSNHSFLWSYATNYLDYLVMFDNFGEIQEWYRFAYDSGFKSIREESQDNGQYGGGTGFINFKSYLHSKLQWSVDLDVEKLTNDYFANYFGPAAGIMRDLFDETRIYIAGLKELPENNFGGVNSMWDGYVAANEIYWKKPSLTYWFEKANDAIKAIEPIKTYDPVKYEILYDHIIMERISYEYLLAVACQDDLSAEELNFYRQTLKTDVYKIGMTLMHEHASITDLIGNW